MEHNLLLEMVTVEADHTLMDLVVFFGPEADHIQHHTLLPETDSHNRVVRLEALHNQAELSREG